jgi:hypothetical protein
MVMGREGGIRGERRIDAAMQYLLLQEIQRVVELPAKEMRCKSKALCSVDS